MNCVFPYEKLPAKKKKNKGPGWKKLFSPDNLKVSFLAVSMLGIGLVYIITVNISSTQGYYYDQMIKQQDKADFKYNVVKLSNLTLQSELRTTINFNTPLKKDSIQYVQVSE